MRQATSLKLVFIFWLVCAILQQVEVNSASGECSVGAFKCANGKCRSFRDLCDGYDDCGDNSDEKVCEEDDCHPSTFQCSNGKCITRTWYCNLGNDCGDNSDEWNCNLNYAAQCMPGLKFCPSGRICIPWAWVCDGIKDCPGETEEKNCGNKTRIMSVKTTEILPESTTEIPPDNSAEKLPDYTSAKDKLKSFLLKTRNPSSRIGKWGSEVHRIAVSLHLADNSTFGDGNGVGENIQLELTIQLFHRLGKDRRLSSQELALYIHALLVSCMDPRDFYGDNLVQELRQRVEASGNCTNPFLILVLCNAGDNMTERDVKKVIDAYYSRRRPFWTDYQALSSMALSCISSRSSGLVNENVLKDMMQELVRRQSRNGTVENYRTTALVTQALLLYDSYKKDFDLDSALKVLADGQNESMSLLDAYYALPVLHQKSLLNVTSSHCRKEPDEEEEDSQIALDIEGETITIQFSVWTGDERNLVRTRQIQMPANSTVYDALETLAKIDKKQKVKYNVVDGKPFVAALYGKEDDPDMGMFWFVYLKTLSSDEDPKIVEESPVDVKLKPNQEIILWYNSGLWRDQSPIRKPATSP